MDRREFLKRSGAAAAACTLASCTRGSNDDASAVNGEMTLRTNPNSGDRVSILGYGCMRWPMTKNAEGKDVIDQETVNALVDEAIAGGVNYFDAAPVYIGGNCEKATGIALSRHPRESYYIATKLSNFSNWDRENSLLMYRKSLEYFQTDYLDYYLLHSIGSEAEFRRRFVDNGMMDFLMEERKAGRIRNLGFSFHGKKQGFDDLVALHGKYHWDFVQIQMNWIDWRHASRDANAEYMYNELYSRGIPVVIMEPLLGGRLAKVPDPIAERLLSREPSRSIASWAFRFCGTYPGVLTALSGMSYKEHLEDNLRSFCPLEPLSEEDLEFLEATAKLMTEYPTVPCTACQYCMPCPYGIDIPGVFAHYNKCINEGYVVDPGDTTIPQREFRKARRAYLVSYSRSVEKIRQADHCVGCGMCMMECPQGIDIPSQLHRLDSYVDKLRRTQD